MHGPDDYVIWRLPLARALALYAAIGPRYGAESRGMTFVEAAMVRAMRRVREQQQTTDSTFQ